MSRNHDDLEDDLNTYARCADLLREGVEQIAILAREAGHSSIWIKADGISQQLRGLSFDLVDAADRAVGLRAWEDEQ